MTKKQSMPPKVHENFIFTSITNRNDLQSQSTKRPAYNSLIYTAYSHLISKSKQKVQIIENIATYNIFSVESIHEKFIIHQK